MVSSSSLSLSIRQFFLNLVFSRFTCFQIAESLPLFAFCRFPSVSTSEKSAKYIYIYIFFFIHFGGLYLNMEQCVKCS